MRKTITFAFALFVALLLFYAPRAFGDELPTPAPASDLVPALPQEPARDVVTFETYVKVVEIKYAGEPGDGGERSCAEYAELVSEGQTYLAIGEETCEVLEHRAGDRLLVNGTVERIVAPGGDRHLVLLIAVVRPAFLY